MWTLATLAAAAELDVTCRPGGDTLTLVGLPPFEVRCTAAYPDGTLAEGAEWRFGDGATGSGPVVSHEYAEVGRYVLAAEVREAPATGDTGAPTEWSRRGEVTVCGAPRPRFDLHFRGGLIYQTENTTPPDPGCISELRWDVFRGAGQRGEPVSTTTNWSPRLTLPEEGEYTIVLSIGGIGGVAASAATIQAEGGLTDAFREIGATLCATGPGAPPVAALLALAALRRRRR
jgi:uncharacterized protein (TIGR03382 family)